MRKIYFALALCLVGCSTNVSSSLNTNVNNNQQTSDNSIHSSCIVSSGIVDISGTTISLSDSGSKVNGIGASVNDKKVIISSAGTYIFSGSLTNGQIVVDSKASGDVNIILNGVSITNNDANILVSNAEKTIVTTSLSSTNCLRDTDSSDALVSSREATAVVYSKDDLVLVGSGELYISTVFSDGVKSNDDLVIKNGTYIITSKDDGIIGKDSLVIENGNFIIKSSGDALKASNNVDKLLGNIEITNGNFNLKSLGDALQAESNLTINGGTYDIETTGDVDTSSSKGLKAMVNLIINDGTFILDTSDDAIHANGDISIKNGTYVLTSQDDGIHADGTLSIDNGEISVADAYEGLEASNIIINGGNINVNAKDDGINVAGGSDDSSINGRSGQNNFKNLSNASLIINGGNIYVNAVGDGLDSNGSIEMNDGVLVIEGPSDSGNGALDYDVTFNLNGGTLFAISSSGMSQTSSSTSLQYMLASSTTEQSANTLISIIDSSNKVIYSFTSSKAFSSIMYSSNQLIANGTYSIKVNDTNLGSVSLDSIVTYINKDGGMSGNNGGFGPKGDQGMGKTPIGEPRLDNQGKGEKPFLNSEYMN